MATSGAFDTENLVAGMRNPAAALRHRFAARGSPAADKRVLRAASAPAWIPRTMIDDSPPRAAAACGWPAARFRDARSPATDRRPDSNDRRSARDRDSGRHRPWAELARPC